MKQYKKWMILMTAVAAAIALVLCLHCWKESKANKTFSLIYIPKTEDGTNDFWTSLIAGTRIAAKEYGVSLEILAPAREQDVKQQNELLAVAVEKRPDAILISPSSFTESEELLKEAKAQGIFVTYVDSYTENEIQDLTVATDNLEVGRKLGEYTTGLLDENSRLAVVGHVKGVSTAVEREKGFREGLGKLAENIVEVVYCDSLYEKSYNLTKELLEKYPDLELIAGLNEYSSVGAARAVKDCGAENRVKVVGVDSSQEAVGLMEQGIFQGIVVQKAFKMGYLGVKETVRMLKGEEVEKNTDSGSELVTPENMYTSEIEKLLFPFGGI
ncbi:MAG: substrate-binding domain-containing protein [Eubacteriales bacterium]|nr:substrate-binding domain-containing protein [Eubacteriales bacterium]